MCLSFPCLKIVRFVLKFTESETAKMKIQIDRMKEKGIIEIASHKRGEYVSNIFCRPKKDGTVRIILNHKHLNNTVQHHHFKMETLNHAIEMMTPRCYMGYH